MSSDFAIVMDNVAFGGFRRTAFAHPEGCALLPPKRLLLFRDCREAPMCASEKRNDTQVVPYFARMMEAPNPITKPSLPKGGGTTEGGGRIHFSKNDLISIYSRGTLIPHNYALFRQEAHCRGIWCLTPGFIHSLSRHHDGSVFMIKKELEDFIL